MSDIKTELLKNETVRQQIAERAYFLAENNSFAPGREMDFWLAAEEEVISSVLPTNGTAAPAKAAKKTAAKPAAAKAAPVAAAPAEAPAKPAPRKRTVKKADV